MRWTAESKTRRGRWAQHGRRVFFTIALPLAAPGVLAGAILGFARAIGEFGATIAFAANIPGETQTLPLAIYSALQSPDGEDGGISVWR